MFAGLRTLCNSHTSGGTPISYLGTANIKYDVSRILP